MADFDFKSLINNIAPTIATMLGGPLAGMAVKAIGSAIGLSDATQDKIEDVIKSGQLSADQIVAIKTAEKEMVVKLRELDVKADELVYKDKDSARTMQVQTKSKIPGYLAISITGGFFAILMGMMFGFLKTSGNSEALLILLGSLSTSFGAIIQFYFGSSKSSEDKNQVIHDAVQRNGNGH